MKKAILFLFLISIILVGYSFADVPGEGCSVRGPHYVFDPSSGDCIFIPTIN